ncbi:ABC transporter ATP-binding protein [Acetobacterium sp.]|uniref:ABC transporter ATP-binding protein n=1 Tax=Acetobacterium sp. TaxID=1872094 RepID=UPI003594806A
MNQIELKNITKHYQKNEPPAVAAINLSVNYGESVVLVGPSGSGKTTILKLIAGLSEASSGSLLLDGKDACSRPPWDRGIGMVFQNGGLYPHMTVYQNISFGLERALSDKARIAEEVQRTAALLGISGLLARKPGELSGGQRQRVAIGRAIIRKPQILLMDEPLSNLEPGSRRQLRDELIALRSRLGITCIYVTHDQTEAMTIGERVVVLNEGKIEQIGTPQNLYHKPDNVFVASFFGDPPMNYINSARLENKNHRWRLSLLNKEINLPDNPFGKQPCDEPAALEVIVGIRPADICLCDPDLATAFLGELEEAQWLGADSILQLKCGIDKLLLRVDGEQNLAKGSLVAFTVKPAELYLFHKKTRRRLCNG